MLTKALGALIYLLFFSPLIAVQMGLSFFLFIDKLLEGQFLKAFSTLLWSPFKALNVLFTLSLISVQAGWQNDFLNLFRTSSWHLGRFFKQVYNTEPNLFFSVKASSMIGFFEGNFFGKILNKLTLLFFPSLDFDTYECYEDSPHNPAQTLTMNTLFKQMVNEHMPIIAQNEAVIYKEIEAFLEKKIKEASPEEKILRNASLICLKRFKDEAKNSSLNKAMDLSSATPENALHALYLVWLELKKTHVEEDSLTEKQNLLTAYLGHIQRGFRRLETPVDNAPDEPECATGALAIMLSVIKTEPTKIESTSKIHKLLDERLTQEYNIKENIQASISNMVGVPQEKHKKIQSEAWNRDAFVTENKALIGYYARFLNETPQGKRSTGLNSVSKTDLDATVEATLEAWEPPSAKGG